MEQEDCIRGTDPLLFSEHNQQDYPLIFDYSP